MTSDRFNPIFVYEIRQAVRNRMILSVLCVYLAAMVGVTAWHFYEAIQSGALPGLDGSELLLELLRLLALFSIGTVCAFSVGMTVRQGLEEELLYQTRLNWFRTACGKAQAAALLTLLFYAVTLPLLTLAWLMRGVDIFHLAVFLVFLFLATQCLAFYLTAAVIRCRNWTDVVSAALGMIPAIPPWWLILATGGQMAVLMTRASGFRYVFGLPFFGVLVMLLSIAFFTGEMFRTNWIRGTALRRFSRVATAIWFAALLAGMAGSLLGLISRIAFDLLRAILGG